MLGEDHSLILEFPEFKEQIRASCESDRTFSRDAIRYDSLDAEIRELELRDSPINDDAMHQLKVERANLKDTLFSILSAAK